MEYYPFDSRNSLYRSKLGAVADGETLRLRLLLHNDAHVYEAFLLFSDDFGNTSEIKLEKREQLENYRFYDCEVTPKNGIYWYSFRYTSEYGEFYVNREKHSLGIVSREKRKAWQLTVYDGNFKTPDWLSGGIIYQIFPDRFFASGEKKEDVPTDRFLCGDWSKQPEYRQNNGPCSLGNDYYGGDFKGIEQKLGYLSDLGVSCIYMNPVFEAHSNHRYNTADYMKLDPLLGNEKDLQSLIDAAKKRGIYIVFDGVFSHTGDDSRYFNRYNRYDTVGAYNSTQSPYYSWYKFNNYPDSYSAWWGVPSLPETNEEDPSFTEFITGKDGVIRYWLKKGIRGWRLDVADELPDAFLDNIRKAVKAEGADKFLLGEVWEDATNKISYGARRKFLRGSQLDSVMNYPFSEAIFAFLKGGDADELMDSVLDIIENYPPEAVKLLMNHIGTHDTVRAITRLGIDDGYVGDRAWQSSRVMTYDEYSKGVRLLMIAAVLQYTLPGVPSLYYGDEAGLAGYGDPFCRGTYPWGKENAALVEFYKKLGKMRRSNRAFDNGEFIPVYASFGSVIYERKKGASSVLVAVNRWCEPAYADIPDRFRTAKALFGEYDGADRLLIPAQGFVILKK